MTQQIRLHYQTDDHCGKLLCTFFDLCVSQFFVLIFITFVCRFLIHCLIYYWTDKVFTPWVLLRSSPETRQKPLLEEKYLPTSTFWVLAHLVQTSKKRQVCWLLNDSSLSATCDCFGFELGFCSEHNSKLCFKCPITIPKYTPNCL